MRARTGCQSCRDRHLKCVRPDGAEICLKCEEAGRPCVQNSKRCFRPVTSVRVKTAGGRLTKQDLKFGVKQVWVDVPSAVSFVSPDHVVENDRDTLMTLEDGDDTALCLSSPEISSSRNAQILYSPEHVQMSAFVRQVTNHTPTPNESDDHHTIRRPAISEAAYSPLSQYRPNSSAARGTGTPRLSDVLARSSHHTSPAFNSVTSPYPLSTSWPFNTAREARLFHHYIINIAPWIDVCDKNRHFGTEVPKRAAHYPVLANAIFAFSSRHLHLLAGSEDIESHPYVSECLQILIANLEDPLGHWDENFLAAVILLRSHEEMSDNDERCHLFGTTKLLNSISSFAADGGLRESASWASLRQHIYISLTAQHPLAIDLTTYRHSSAFSDQNDESIANRIIFVFASILTAVFQPDSQLSAVRWEELDAEVQKWEASKPWDFSLMWRESCGTSGQAQKGSWPEMLMSQPAQVVGMQYYCLCKIVLSIYDPRLPKIGFASHRLRRASHALVLENLRMVVGLAVSNKNVVNAMFQACHILSACGSHIDSQSDQDAAEDFLVEMQAQMGWRTSHIIRDLREQWRS